MGLDHINSTPLLSYTLGRGGVTAAARASAVIVAEMPSIRLLDLPRSDLNGCTLSLQQ
jgi:hypothetical protein